MREKAGRKLPKMHFKQQNRRIQTTIRKSQAGMENDGSISKKPVFIPVLIGCSLQAQYCSVLGF